MSLNRVSLYIALFLCGICLALPPLSPQGWGSSQGKKPWVYAILPYSQQQVRGGGSKSSVWFITTLPLLQTTPGAGLALSWLSVATHKQGCFEFGSHRRTKPRVTAAVCGMALSVFLCTSGFCDTARTAKGCSI